MHIISTNNDRHYNGMYAEINCLSSKWLNWQLFLSHTLDPENSNYDNRIIQTKTIVL